MLVSSSFSLFDERNSYFLSVCLRLDRGTMADKFPSKKEVSHSQRKSAVLGIHPPTAGGHPVRVESLRRSTSTTFPTARRRFGHASPPIKSWHRLDVDSHVASKPSDDVSLQGNVQIDKTWLSIQ